jgi:hypothetical protein
VDESDSDNHVSAIPSWGQDPWSDSVGTSESPAPGWSEEEPSADEGDDDDVEQGQDEDAEDDSAVGSGGSSAAFLSRTVR